MPMTYGVRPSPQLNNQCRLPYYAWVGQRALTSELLFLMVVEQSIPQESPLDSGLLRHIGLTGLDHFSARLIYSHQ